MSGEQVELAYEVPDEQRVRYVVSPLPGQLMNAEAIGGQLVELSKLFKALAFDEAAERLGIELDRLRQYVDSGDLPYISLGSGTKRVRARKIHPDDLAALKLKLDLRRAYGDETPRGFVYFMVRGDFVKVGYSAQPRTRLTQLQISSPEKIRLRLAVPGTEADEKAIHWLLRRTRAQGEWFYLTREAGDVIDACRKAGAAHLDLISPHLPEIRT